MRIVLFLLVMFMFQSCFNVRSTQHFAYTKLSPQDYRQELSKAKDYYLIDVRTAGEYRKGHVEGAVNYSYLKFNFAKKVEALDRKKTVFIYCQTCHRSPFCARILKRKGFATVYDIKKGYIKWHKAKLPEVQLSNE